MLRDKTTWTGDTEPAPMELDADAGDECTPPELGLLLKRPRRKSAQLGPLLREGIVEIAPGSPAEVRASCSLHERQARSEQHASFRQLIAAQKQPPALHKRMPSPDADADPPPPKIAASSSLFPLEREEILDAVAKAISLHICHDGSLPVPAELAIFDAAHIEGPPFSGSEREIRQLLETMVNLNLDPNVRPAPRRTLPACAPCACLGSGSPRRPSARPFKTPQALIVASVFIERLVQRVGQKAAPAQRGPRARLISASAARAIILTMVLLASKFNFDEGVRMKHVRADSDACNALGPGIVNRFSKLEEHVLLLFDWQLRVTATEYAAHYERLVDSQRSVSMAMRVMSVPSSLFLLCSEGEEV